MQLERNESDSTNVLRDIGCSLGRRISYRLTETLAPFVEPKDAVKFICKDMWFYLFRQQATRLQANRKGVFVIHDATFPPLQTVAKSCVSSTQSFSSQPSADIGVGPLSHPKLVATTIQQEATESSPVSSKIVSSSSFIPNIIQQRALDSLSFYAGVIEGFLQSSGYIASVECSVSGQLPACAFQVNLRQSTSEVLDPSRLLGNINSPESASI